MSPAGLTGVYGLSGPLAGRPPDYYALHLSATGVERARPSLCPPAKTRYYQREACRPLARQRGKTDKKLKKSSGSNFFTRGRP